MGDYARYATLNELRMRGRFALFFTKNLLNLEAEKNLTKAFLGSLLAYFTLTPCFQNPFYHEKDRLSLAKKSRATSLLFVLFATPCYVYAAA